MIVVGRELADPRRTASLVERDGEAASTMLEAEEFERWQPIESVDLPAGSAYLVADIDTGAETIDVRPNDAIERIAAAGRSPLTLEEGIALVTHHPDALAKNACFYMLGSRCGDKRVVALWLSKGAPKLGWCWAGNPHTWLGLGVVRGTGGRLVHVTRQAASSRLTRCSASLASHSYCLTHLRIAVSETPYLRPTAM